MPNPPLQSGDKVVDLAALTRTGALLAGAISAAWMSWLVSYTPGLICLSALVGAVVGLILGGVAGGLFFRLVKGEVMVVKTGMNSLPLTVRASLSGALLAAVVAALIGSIVFRAQWQAFAEVSILTGVAVGMAVAFLSSLL